MSLSDLCINPVGSKSAEKRLTVCQHVWLFFFPLRAQLKPCRQALRSWPSRWRLQTTCLAWPTWPESWWGCASAAWATGTSTHPSSWASSCGRSTTASPTSGTRARTRCPRSCTRCDRAWGKWRTPATPCASAAQKSPNTCWLMCSPVGPHSSTPRKEWFKSCSCFISTLCSLWCHCLLCFCSSWMIVCVLNAVWQMFNVLQCALCYYSNKNSFIIDNVYFLW